jgi:hypothetical protein
MADTKITALAAIGANPINVATFPIPMVDLLDTSMAASGTTKKVTVNQILQAGGTATLASATITGDLTVDTSTLKVDSTNNRVGVGTATPGFPLDIIGASGVGLRIYESSTGNNNRLQITQEGTETRFNSTFSTGSAFYTWQIASSEQMRLNSTGLNIGGGIDASLSVRRTLTGTASAVTNILRLDSNGSGNTTKITLTDGVTSDSYITHTGGSTANQLLGLGCQGVQQLVINGSGNVGVGVTPSAWSTTGNIQLPAGAGTSGIFSSNRYAIFGSNAYFNSGWKYTSTAAAAMYIQDASAHQWFSAGSGTAGNAITWTQAMTLDASGNLLVGKSSAVATAVGIQFQPLGTSYHTLSASTNSDTTLLVYSTGAAAYRFYVGLGGTVFATNTTISAISDQRLKENIQDIDVGLGAILALKPRKFDWKAGKGKDIKGDRGFIAQEFEQVFPNLVDEWKDNAPEGEAPYKSVRQDLIPVLVKAIQELTARVEALEA